MLRLPKKDFLRVLTAYCKHIEMNQPKRTRENRFNLLECYRDEDWAYIDNCNIKNLNTDLPDLKIQIDKYIYTIKPDQFVLPLTGYGRVCYINIRDEGTESAHWILGSPFLNQYYQVYDMQRNQQGLVASIYENNADGQKVKAVINTDESYSSNQIIIISVCLLVVITAIRGYLIKFLRMKM